MLVQYWLNIGGNDGPTLASNIGPMQFAHWPNIGSLHWRNVGPIFVVTFLLRIFWKIFFMIIDLISFRYLKIIMKQSTILL